MPKNTCDLGGTRASLVPFDVLHFLFLRRGKRMNLVGRKGGDLPEWMESCVASRPHPRA